MSPFPRASEKGPQVHSRGRVVKTASKNQRAAGLGHPTPDRENSKPVEVAAPSSFATKSIWNAFSRDAY